MKLDPLAIVGWDGPAVRRSLRDVSRPLFWYFVVVAAFAAAGWAFLGTPQKDREELLTQLTFLVALGVVAAPPGLVILYVSLRPTRQFSVGLGQFTGDDEKSRNRALNLRRDLEDVLAELQRNTNLKVSSIHRAHLVVTARISIEEDHAATKLYFATKEVYEGEPLPPFLGPISLIEDLRREDASVRGATLERHATSVNLLFLAVLHFATGRYEAAAADLGTVRTADDRDPALSLLQAHVCQALSKLTDAISIYRKILDCEPRCVDAYRALGKAYTDIGRYDDALAVLEEGLRIEPLDIGMRLYLARARTLTGHPDLAEATFDEVLAQRNIYEVYRTIALVNHANNHLVLAEMAREARLSQEVSRRLALARRSVLRALGHARALRHKYAAHELLGIIYGAQGRFPKAEYHLSLATHLNPKSFRAAFALAELQMKQGNHQAAADAYALLLHDASIEKQPAERATLVFDIAAQLNKLARRDDAIRWIKEGVQSGLFDEKVPSRDISFRGYFFEDTTFANLWHDLEVLSLLRV